ncbi:MAG: hypothetical protein K9N55_06415 [Phycisphaerae bacterium]|nr:hypothetical protein [Phycisphaerae bacterium]
MRPSGIWWIVLTLYVTMAWAQEDYSFDLSEIEEKPCQFGGYFEFYPIVYGLDEDSTAHKLKFYDRDSEPLRYETNFTALLDGSYKKGTSEFRAIVNTDAKHDDLGWSEETTLYEGTWSLRPSPGLSFQVGKATLKWGKGYAWNPVAFLDRPKDPTDPELAREGFVVASADYIKSFEGPLKTFSFTPALVPVYDHLNEDLGQITGMNVAGRAYFLLHDTDIDFLFLAGPSKTTRYGMDFSRNITSNFEIHGELAIIRDYEQTFIDDTGTLYNRTTHATNTLLGLRYLTESETTTIFEYYHNATGFTESDMGDYYSFIDEGYNTYLASGDTSGLKRASSISKNHYSQKNPMRDYLYLRVSQKEPFDILYFTPSVTSILNVNDHSFSLGPEWLYTGVKNLELRLRTTFLVGDSYTEFGEKQSDFWVGLRARYHY